MELPDHLKDLYRHWPLHTVSREKNSDPHVPEEILQFVKERVSIWKKKTQKGTPPFTKDPILAQYRFCNILRELDAQTIEFHTLLNPLRDDFPLWLLNMFYCRMVARPETIRSVGLLSFDEKKNAELYEKLIVSPRPRYGTPYVFPVSVIQKSPTPTRELFITKHLPSIMQTVAKEIRTWDKKTVYDGVVSILPLFGYNLSFLWTEILIDTAYQYPEKINLFGRFPVGPGSLPTFKKLSTETEPAQLAKELGALGITIDITYEGLPIRLSTENWEGIGCEFRKYTNLKAGKGRKRIYAKRT